MKNLLKILAVAIIVLVLFCPGISFAALTTEEIGEHIWFGVLNVSGHAQFRIAIEVLRKADGNLAAFLTSIDQRDIGILADEFSFENGTARFVIKVADIVIEGPINEDDLSIDAQFTQGGNTIPLPLKIVEELPVIPKKQDPVKPYPYDEETVVFDNPAVGVKLAGTMTIPRSPGPHPAVLLLSGSGPMERNEKAFGHKPFLVLSDYLTRNGFAVLRYDKRGVGRSTGDHHSAKPSDFASDALAGFRYLRSRPDVDPRAVGIVGHSEGGLIAPMIATESPDVAFIVMLAGPGISNCEGIVLQNCAIRRAKGMSEADIVIFHDWIERYHVILRDEKDDDVARKKLNSLFDNMTEDEKRIVPTPRHAIDADLSSPWFREFIAGDPRPTLRKVTCPVLALNGSKDVQVSAKENLRGIEESLKAAGNTRYTVKEMPDMNHLFQVTDKTGAVEEYKDIEETMSPVVLDTIAQWLVSQTERYAQGK
ncbi:alpha/beta fold hydrolase [bacterium]|nr:alpha/beta fold hydrolase [bacterium]